MLVNGKLKEMSKLFFAGMLILFVFLKSPLNPLYSDYKYGEMFTVYYYFSLWLIIASLIFWLLFFFKKEHLEKYKIILFILSVFLWYSNFLPLGFDTTDTGFTLSSQWSMFHGRWENNFNANAGTNLIGGFWLYLLGAPSLLWARIGFALTQTLLCFFIYKTLIIYFDNKKVFFITLSVIFSTSYMQNYFTINYDNLPFLFALISTYFILKAFEGKTDKKDKNLILSGLFSSIAVFSKITYVSYLILPLLIVIFYSEKKEEHKIKNEIVKYFAGLIFTTATILLFMFFTGAYSQYISNFSSILVELLYNKQDSLQTIAMHDHSFIALYNRYFLHHLTLLKYTITCVLTMVFFGIVSKKIRQRKFVLFLFSSAIIWYIYHTLFYEKINQHTAVTGVVIIAFSFIALWLIFYMEYESNKKEIALLLAVSWLYLVSFIGSDLGITPVTRSSSIILLLCFGMLLVTKTKHKSRIDFYFLVPLLLSLLWFVRFVSDISEHYPYRDSNMKMIKFSFESQPLLGIRSNFKRVNVVDSLYSYMKEIDGLEQKKVLFTHNNALGYFITGTNYILDTPWDTLNDINKMKKDFREKSPDIIVTSKLTHRYELWPYYDENEKWISNSGYEKKAQVYYDYYSELIKKNNFVEVYKNSFYTVYSLGKEEKDHGKIKE